MIIIESKKKKLENIRKLYSNSEIIDVTSKGEYPFVMFSPFYPHGNIPIPFSENKFGKSVEGIWQGLKVFDCEGIDESRFYIDDMKNIKRSSRSHGRVLGHQKGINSNELLNYPSARKEIYLRTYAWVLDNLLQDLVSQLKEIAFKKDLILLDYETNIDIDNYKKPLSHAGLVKRYLEKKYPELKELRFTETMSEKDSEKVKSKRVKKDIKKEKEKILEKTEETTRIDEPDQLALFKAIVVSLGKDK